MLTAGILIILGALLDAFLTGVSLVDMLAVLSGLFLIIMKTPVGKKLFRDSTRVNLILSRLIIIAAAIAVIIVPLSFVNGKGSGRMLDSVLEKSAALVERGEFDKAYKLLDDFTGGEEIPEILQNKAAIHIRKGESREAEDLISKAAAYKNMDAGMLFNTGLCYFQNGHYNEAANYFERAVLIDPEMWLSYYYAGEAYYIKKNYRSAQYHYNEALKIAHDNPNIYYSLAQTKMDKMEFAEAKELLTEAKKLDMQQELLMKINKLEDSIDYYINLTADNS
jgi:tetratricopeptide (TPR) repeat protein